MSGKKNTYHFYQGSSVPNYLTSNGLDDCILETIENQDRFDDNPFPILSNNCIRVDKRILLMMYGVCDILRHLIIFLVGITFMLVVCGVKLRFYKTCIRAFIYHYDTFVTEGKTIKIV